MSNSADKESDFVRMAKHGNVILYRAIDSVQRHIHNQSWWKCLNRVMTYRVIDMKWNLAFYMCANRPTTYLNDYCKTCCHPWFPTACLMHWEMEGADLWFGPYFKGDYQHIHECFISDVFSLCIFVIILVLVCVNACVCTCVGMNTCAFFHSIFTV